MARLTNRCLQVLFKDKDGDGFLLAPDRKRVFYYYSFQDFDKGKEVDVRAVVGFGDKENKAGTGAQAISAIFKTKN